MFFLLFLLNDRRIPIRIRETQKHMDPTDPDSDLDTQHWKVRYVIHSIRHLQLYPRCP
jgi:hypothetical protein